MEENLFFTPVCHFKGQYQGTKGNCYTIVPVTTHLTAIFWDNPGELINTRKTLTHSISLWILSYILLHYNHLTAFF